jgi:hypothetical protein
MMLRIIARTKFVRPDWARPTATTCGFSAKLTNAGPSVLSDKPNGTISRGDRGSTRVP